MESGFNLWMGLAGLVGLVWLFRFIMIGPAIRSRVVLRSDSHNSPPADPPRVSVLVAAKDEEECIEACVLGLLDQDYPNFEVIVVDDRSEDATPRILNRLQKEAPDRLNSLRIEHLPDGWFGKNHAMHQGVAAARGDWLCFTDADCLQTSRSTLTVAMCDALAHESDFLSITPILETVTLSEKILQPACALILIFWFQPSRVNNPKVRTAYANGAFMLMTRRCYEGLGGHEAVAGRINEDIEFARLAKNAGFRLRVVGNDDLYTTRMYRSFGQAFRGWSRILYGCLNGLPRLATSATMITFFGLVPWLSLVFAVVQGLRYGNETSQSWPLAIAAWGAVICLMQAVLWRLYGALKTPRAWSLTYVFGAAIAVGMLMNAMWKQIGAGGTTWRGTTYMGSRAGQTEPKKFDSSGNLPVREIAGK